MISKIPYLINRILAKSEIILKSSTPPNAIEKGLYDDIIELKSLLDLTNLPNELLPKVNGEYQCEHIKEKIIRSSCVWCNLTVAEKIIERLKRELTNLKPALDNENDLGLFIYSILSGYDKELSLEQWTAKHIQTETKKNSAKLAHAICSHFSKFIKYPEKRDEIPFCREMAITIKTWNECIDDMRLLNGEGV